MQRFISVIWQTSRGGGLDSFPKVSLRSSCEVTNGDRHSWIEYGGSKENGTENRTETEPEP